LIWLQSQIDSNDNDISTLQTSQLYQVIHQL
jgi:hypothetical protein